MKKNCFSALIVFIVMFAANESYPQMFWNRACSFSGDTMSYVSVRNHSTLNITASFTIEAWVCPVNSTSPSFQIILQKRVGGNGNGYTLYLNQGRVAIRTNSNTRLIGTTVIPNNGWTHIAGTYNSTSGLFTVYVNGTSDGSAVVAAAAPVTNTDSVYIGKGSNDPFEGQMDEIRVWNKVQNSTFISQNRRTSLGANTGKYAGLVLSLPFQSTISTINSLSTTDLSGNNNNAVAVNVADVNLKNRPYTTIALNDCLELDGADDYVSGVDNPAISPTTAMTLEAWIFPRANSNAVIIHKGTADGITTNYRLSLFEGKLRGCVNANFGFTTTDTVPLNRWSHAAFTYVSSGDYKFYLNGKLIKSGVNNVGAIADGFDSVFIGGNIDLTDFNGYIDEVRITEAAKSQEEINNFLFTSIDDLNEPAADDAVYNLDGYNRSSTLVGPFLNFRNQATFSYSAVINNQPISPLNRVDVKNFQKSFITKTSNRRIPASGTSGLMVDDTLDVLFSDNITDINVFIGLNHTYEGDLEISLIAPNNEAVVIFDNVELVAGDNLITVFDDNADSSLINNRYTGFGPRIKPSNNMNSVFGGDNPSGKWRLRINDAAAADTGRLYGWGIQFNNSTTKQFLLSTKTYIEGFYNPATNLMVRDTMRYYFRNKLSPYAVVDSGIAYLPTDGSAVVKFTNLTSAVDYYMQLKHRNSIETWNKNFISFDPLSYQAYYNFTDNITKAYGDNMAQVDAAPAAFAIFGGDVNQDGNVDVVDLGLIEDDAFNFVSGYIRTDLNGDNQADAVDLAIADNNAFDFVTKVTPPIVLGNVSQEINLSESSSISGEPNLQSSQTFNNNFYDANSGSEGTKKEGMENDSKIISIPSKKDYEDADRISR